MMSFSTFSSKQTQSAPQTSSLFGNTNANSSSAPLSALEMAANEDPLQPLRTMADRVGKEVEDFAMRVDEWYTNGNESEKAKYRATLHMVDKFKKIADSSVQELREFNAAENRGELQKSVRRRIKNMAEEKDANLQSDNSRPFQSVIPSIEASSAAPSARVQELRQWEAEAATWDLLRVIIEHYHPEPDTDPAAEKQSRLEEVGGDHRYSPNIEIWNRFLLEDDKAKEKELILRWLERTAQNSESELDTITEQLEAESGKGTHTWTSGWLDTRTRIKQLKRQTGKAEPLGTEYSSMRTKDGTQELVTQLDPDAPARQSRALEKSDEYYERALWMMCYEMMRRGVPWEELSEWCKDRSEAWRGISLGAADKPRPQGVPNISGPTVGFLFRRTCFYAAKGSRTQYESAVYGLLSGDVKEVEPVCRTWDDHLYTRYNALLLSRFDNWLKDNHPNRLSQTLAQKFVFQDAVAQTGNWENASARIIESLKQQKSTAALATLPMKLIQGGLISGSMEDLLHSVGAAITKILQKDNRSTGLILDPSSKSSSKDMKTLSPRNPTAEQTLVSDPNGLRTLVHVFIVLRNGLGLFDVENVARAPPKSGDWNDIPDDFLKTRPKGAALDNVIVTYIEFLRISKRIELIPLYAAQLEVDRRYHCLARILPDIRNADEQKTFIGLLRQYHIDPLRVIKENFVLTSHEFRKETSIAEISEFDMLEPTTEVDQHSKYLWPGKRVKSQFSGMRIEPSDLPMLESLQWHAHLEKELEGTFEILHSGLTSLLLAGRIGAAIQLVEDMSLEKISLIKTQALCGYAFDFFAENAELQDETQVMSSSRRSHRPSHFPSPDDHAQYVYTLRENAQVYSDLQQLVHLIVWYHEWREEEDHLMQVKAQSTAKPSTKRIKDLFENIQTTLEPLLLDPFIDDIDSGPRSDARKLKHIYLPEVIIAYLCIVQTYAYVTSRETVTKAMDIATLVADEKSAWLQDVFVDTGRMTELVETLAGVSRAMLRMGEADKAGKNKGAVKKRGSHGETLRVWDVNSRN